MEKKYNVLVKIYKKCDGCGVGSNFTWHAVKPTDGLPYSFSKQEAEHYLDVYDTGNGNLKIQEI